MPASVWAGQEPFAADLKAEEALIKAQGKGDAPSAGQPVQQMWEEDAAARAIQSRIRASKAAPVAMESGEDDLVTMYAELTSELAAALA